MLSDNLLEVFYIWVFMYDFKTTYVIDYAVP